MQSKHITICAVAPAQYSDIGCSSHCTIIYGPWGFAATAQSTCDACISYQQSQFQILRSRVSQNSGQSFQNPLPSTHPKPPHMLSFSCPQPPASHLPEYLSVATCGLSHCCTGHCPAALSPEALGSDHSWEHAGVLANK